MKHVEEWSNIQAFTAVQMTQVRAAKSKLKKWD
jgi:hypothetical protein